MKQFYDKTSKKCQKRDLSSAFQNIEYQEVNINSGTHMHLPLKPGTTRCSVSIHTPCFINIRIRISADK
ncbi:TPA: hypothetical protein HMM04_21980 [Escherichia coli]|nr:hypothetical protein DJ491_17125 [Escherichia coli]HAG8052805.1 hypothetical protein [Escherichia coli]HAJ1959829.1 hypothetical protein [Escherichia coli]HAJ2017954.1 hypothetical protein [Escherichia coli]